MNFAALTQPQRLSLGAIAAVIIGAFLPWFSIFGISASGISGDGVITLILALVGAALLMFSSPVLGTPRIPSKVADIGLIVLAALVTLVALIDMSSFAAFGLYLTLFAGLAWLAGAVWQLLLTRKTASGAQVDAP